MTCMRNNPTRAGENVFAKLVFEIPDEPLAEVDSDGNSSSDGAGISSSANGAGATGNKPQRRVSKWWSGSDNLAMNESDTMINHRDGTHLDANFGVQQLSLRGEDNSSAMSSGGGKGGWKEKESEGRHSSVHECTADTKVKTKDKGRTKDVRIRADSVITDPYYCEHVVQVTHDPATDMYEGLPSDWKKHLSQQFGVDLKYLRARLLGVDMFGASFTAMDTDILSSVGIATAHGQTHRAMRANAPDVTGIPAFASLVPVVLDDLKECLIEAGGLDGVGIFRKAAGKEKYEAVKKLINTGLCVREALAAVLVSTTATATATATTSSTDRHTDASISTSAFASMISHGAAMNNHNNTDIHASHAKGDDSAGVDIFKHPETMHIVATLIKHVYRDLPTLVMHVLSVDEISRGGPYM